MYSVKFSICKILK